MGNNILKILVVVDVLKDFCPGGSFAVPEGDQVVAPINLLLKDDTYQMKVLVGDKHHPNHINFVSEHPGHKPFDKVMFEGKLITLWPEHAVENTPGAQAHPALLSSLLTHYVPKGTDRKVDSLSGFFDDDGVRETGLRTLIESQMELMGITDKRQVQIDVCGLATDYCVAMTARDALKLGFTTAIVVDASRGFNANPGDDIKALRELAAKGVEMKCTQEILELPVPQRQVREIRPGITP